MVSKVVLIVLMELFFGVWSILAQANFFILYVMSFVLCPLKETFPHTWFFLVHEVFN